MPTHQGHIFLLESFSDENLKKVKLLYRKHVVQYCAHTPEKAIVYFSAKTTEYGASTILKRNVVLCKDSLNKNLVSTFGIKTYKSFGALPVQGARTDLHKPQGWF